MFAAVVPKSCTTIGKNMVRKKQLDMIMQMMMMVVVMMTIIIIVELKPLYKS